MFNWLHCSSVPAEPWFPTPFESLVPTCRSTAETRTLLCFCDNKTPNSLLPKEYTRLFYEQQRTWSSRKEKILLPLIPEFVPTSPPAKKKHRKCREKTPGPHQERGREVWFVGLFKCVTQGLTPISLHPQETCQRSFPSCTVKINWLPNTHQFSFQLLKFHSAFSTQR